MSALQALHANELTEVPASPGITRRLSFKGEGFRILRAQSSPDVISGWHHHGDYEVYGFVVSGKARFENEHGEEISVGSGDFFHVPPHTVHREINPSQDEANDMILFLLGNGQLVYNVDDPHKS